MNKRTLLFIKDELAANSIITELALAGIGLERCEMDPKTKLYCLELRTDLNHVNFALNILGLNRDFPGKIVMRMEKGSEWRRNK